MKVNRTVRKACFLQADTLYPLEFEQKQKIEAEPGLRENFPPTYSAELLQWAYRRYYSKLIRYVKRIIPEHMDAEDVVSEVFMRFIRSIPLKPMNSMDHLRRWLYVTARNLSIDYCREKTKGRSSGGFVEWLIDEQAQFIDNIDARTAWSEENRRVVHALDEMENLPIKARAVLKMYLIENKTTSEIANELNIKSQTALNHKAYALQVLKQRILCGKHKFDFLRKRFFVMDGHKIKIDIPFDQVQYIEGFDSYVKVVTSEGSYWSFISVNRLTTSLPKSRFIRVNDRYIVSLKWIVRIDNCSVFLPDKEVPIETRYRVKIRNWEGCTGSYSY